MDSPISTADAPDPIQSAIEHLKGNLGYSCKNFLGKGTYGSVVEVTSSEYEHYAAKIVKKRLVNEMEVCVWPKLHHKNVLKLFDVICNVEGVVIFLTDLMATNLFLRLQCKEFKEDSNAIERCLTYARQVFAGISYLHHLKLCHLDLRSENVFLAGEDDRAVVADFSGLSYAENEKKFCPLPHSMRPPEMLTAKKRPVAPLPIDLWACGLLLANIFLGKGYYACTIKNSRAGQIEAVHQYTALFQSEVYVSKFLEETYPACSFKQSSIRYFINIVHKFLHANPKQRLRVDDALLHPFFTSPSICKPLSEVISEEVKTDLPLLLAKPGEETLQKVTGAVELSETTLSRNSDCTIAVDSIQNKTLDGKAEKTSAWSKYRRWWSDIGKLPLKSSAPLFKPVQFKKIYTKKAKKKKESKKKRDIKK